MTVCAMSCRRRGPRLRERCSATPSGRRSTLSPEVFIIGDPSSIRRASLELLRRLRSRLVRTLCTTERDPPTEIALGHLAVTDDAVTPLGFASIQASVRG